MHAARNRDEGEALPALHLIPIVNMISPEK
jgi:hypothetical protein